jgi:vitamin B12 transporter
MKHIQLMKKETKTFKQWSNSSWGIFSSLGKQIRIALLPLSYFLSAIFTLNAQTDTIQLEDIEIISSRVPVNYSDVGRVIYIIDKDEINSAPVRSLQDLIEYASNVDVRQRGPEGVQADISIRGGNFDQALILLNGFKMNDVQTGHHSMNLPVDIESIERIEILQGPGNRVFGINSYSGAINFITTSEETNKLKASLNGGQYNYLHGYASINYKIKNWKNYLAVSHKSSDGYLKDETINNTDFDILNLFYESKLNTQLADFIVQAGYTDKSFGANSFYTPAYPWQYENTKTLFAGYKTIKNGKKYNFTKSIFWRRHQDRFELFREDMYKRNGDLFIYENDTAPSWYTGHNYHKTNLISAELKYDFQTVAGKSALGTEYRHAFIQSNVLGTEMNEPVEAAFEEFGEYTKEADRFNINIFAEHVFSFKRFTLAGGISTNYNSDYDWQVNGGADLSFDISKHLKLFTSANRAGRLPTFTDLYYDGPTNIGNIDLQPEHALSYEAGLKYFNNGVNFTINGFRRDGKNTIDWVRSADTLQWQPQNITELTTYGFEFAGSYQLANNSYLKRISLAYAYLQTDKLPSDFESRYALDYLKHKLVFSLHHKIIGRLAAHWKFRYEDRNEQFAPYEASSNSYLESIDYDPYGLIDVKVYWANQKLTVYIDISNLTDTDYVDFGNIKMPGIWVKAGVKVNMSL